jgi:hypothetical protein
VVEPPDHQSSISRPVVALGSVPAMANGATRYSRTATARARAVFGGSHRHKQGLYSSETPLLRFSIPCLVLRAIESAQHGLCAERNTSSWRAHVPLVHLLSIAIFGHSILTYAGDCSIARHVLFPSAYMILRQVSSRTLSGIVVGRSAGAALRAALSLSVAKTE